MKDLDYKKDISIDEENLDTEWLRHSATYMQYLEYSVYCSNILEKKEEQLEVLAAELDKEIRSNPGEKKLTENSIKNEILTNNNYKTLKEEIIQARYNYNIVKSAVNAFEHRKKALERLCDLWMFGYNSAPKQNIKDSILDSIQNKVRGGLNK